MHELDIDVHVVMIGLIDHLALDERAQLAQIHHVPRPPIDLAGDGDLERVVVPVSVRIVALAEQLPILGVRQLGIVHAMRGVEA